MDQHGGARPKATQGDRDGGKQEKSNDGDGGPVAASQVDPSKAPMRRKETKREQIERTCREAMARVNARKKRGELPQSSSSSDEQRFRESRRQKPKAEARSQHVERPQSASPQKRSKSAAAQQSGQQKYVPRRARSQSVYPQYFFDVYKRPPVRGYQEGRESSQSDSSLVDSAPSAGYPRRAFPQRPLHRPTDKSGANECLEYMRVKSSNIEPVVDKFFGMVLAPRPDPRYEPVSWKHFKEVALVDPAEHFKDRVGPVKEHWKTCYKPSRRLIYVAKPVPTKLVKINEDYYLEESDSN